LQVLEGMERVRLRVDGQGRDLLTGLHEVQITILRLFGEQVCRVYNCLQAKSVPWPQKQELFQKMFNYLLNVG